MSQQKKWMLWISAGAAVLLVVSFLVYRGIKGRAESVSGDSNPEEMQGAADGLPDWKYHQDNRDPDSGPLWDDGDSAGTADGDSITGLTECKPYGASLVEEGSRNILILGEDKENMLYDTIGIVSISPKSEKVRIIMVPRDTYIKYNKKVLRYLEQAGKLKEPGVFKINYAHHIGPMMKYEGRFKPYTSISFLADVIQEKFGIRVDDYMKIKVDTFAQIVDLFGGIDIHVPYDMNYDDPTQDLTIHLQKGMQHLDGKQAEGFVRFRQGYRADGTPFEIGDEKRKDNQTAFLKAFMKQHGTIKNIDKIPGLLKTFGKNVQHSLGVGDMLFTYMGIGKDAVLKKYEIEGMTLRGDLQWIDSTQYVVIDGE